MLRFTYLVNCFDADIEKVFLYIYFVIVLNGLYINYIITILFTDCSKLFCILTALDFLNQILRI